MTPAGHRPRRRRDETPLDGTEPDIRPEDWKQQLLNALLEVPADAFERLAQRLLREARFASVDVTGRIGDGGIDGTGTLVVENLLSFPIFFQCKRYRGSVAPSVVRDFRGAMAGRGDKGLLITTGTFTREGEREAARPGAPPIDLIDGEKLCDLLKTHCLGMRSRAIEEVTVDREWLEGL